MFLASFYNKPKAIQLLNNLLRKMCHAFGSKEYPGRVWKVGGCLKYLQLFKIKTCCLLSVPQLRTIFANLNFQTVVRAWCVIFPPSIRTTPLWRAIFRPSGPQNRHRKNRAFTIFQIFSARLHFPPPPLPPLPPSPPRPSLFANLLANPLRQPFSPILFASSGLQCAPLDLIRQAPSTVCTAGPHPQLRIAMCTAGPHPPGVHRWDLIRQAPSAV